MKSLWPRPCLVVALVAVLAAAGPARADRGADGAQLANNTKFLFFNMQSLGEYEVRKNATPLPQADATAAGALNFQEIVDNGDQIIVSLVGIGTQPPIPPQQVQARETSPGCVTVSWVANPEPDISGYVVYYGPLSVSQGQVATYANSIDVAGATSREICGFNPGTQYFAVRAYNTSLDFSGYSSERGVNVLGADTTPPSIVSTNPADGAQGVPIDSKVVFSIADGQSGVDSNTVLVTINGAPPDSKRFTGTPANYVVVCEVAGGFSPQSNVTVAVQASDLASPVNSVSDSWSFTTGSTSDVDPPAFCCLSPGDGDTNVNPSSALSIGVSDLGAGVDLSGIELRVNGQFALYTVSGDEANAVITFDNPLGFTPGTTVNVSVTACDLSSANNCATLDYAFDVAPGATSIIVDAQIMPDGYWADDPTRPLEIQNIPLGWTVRIFDTRGYVVRDFKNSQSDGYTWSWDFRNDTGHAVARALYLIRVFNEGGDLQRSGRFLVQRDR